MNDALPRMARLQGADESLRSLLRGPPVVIALLAAAQPALQKEICVVRPPVAPGSLQVVAVVWHAIQVGIEQCAANLAREWQIATMRA